MGTLRSILLHLDATPCAAARLAPARSLALRQEAALSAMFVATPPQRPLQLALAESPAALLLPTDVSAFEETHRRLQDALAQGGPAMQWITAAGDPVDAFCRQALYADLLVLGQPDPHAAPGLAAPADFVGSVMLRTGRAALVLPSSRTVDLRGRDVLIGWNATPSAAHAVAAALPWLRKAHRVHVLEAIDADAPLDDGGLDLMRYLAFHGVIAILHRHRAGPREAGDALLSLAGDVQADLLVMGCYGHSRARELMLGGATRTVLRSMTLPVLMAH